jgi:hypothetical protein
LTEFVFNTEVRDIYLSSSSSMTIQSVSLGPSSADIQSHCSDGLLIDEKTCIIRKVEYIATVLVTTDQGTSPPPVNQGSVRSATFFPSTTNAFLPIPRI